MAKNDGVKGPVKGPNVLLIIVYVVAIGMTAFQLYTGLFGSLEGFAQRSIHVAFALLLAFLIYPAKGRSKSALSIWDMVYLVLVVLTMGYLIVAHHYLVYVRLPYATSVTPWQTAAGIMMIGLTLEATRRAVGPQLPVFALVFIVYSFLGQYLPAPLGHPGVPLDLFIDVQYLTTAGIFTTPIALSSTYLFLFILLGVTLGKIGFGEFLIDFANALTGRSRGGPAKVAVISSALVGTITGSAVANVVTTGTFTISLMKRMGFKPHYAGAVEAVASSGGQIMPPVMGAAAFLMAEFTAIPYITICRYALLPAFLYYVSVFFAIDLESAKEGLKGLPKDQIPQLRNTIKGAYLAAPIVVLLALLIIGYTPNLGGSVAVLSAFAVGLIARKIGLEKLAAIFRDTAREAIPVVLACATAGIIVGVVNLTGLGNNLTRLIVTLCGGRVLLALILTMVAGIILGMGLPTGPMYVVQVALIIPALIELGVPMYIAHMFIIYFAAISMITPPVCLASFAAAGVAGADSMKTGWTGMRLGAVSYIVPFMFAFSPALLLEGTLPEVLLAVFTSTIGVYALAVSMEGYLMGRIGFISRIIAFVAALLLIKPGFATDIMGITCLVAVFLMQVRSRNIAGYIPKKG